MLPVGPSVVDADPDNVAVKEGQELVLFCSSDCKPGCTFEWTGPGGGEFGSGNRLTIDSVGRGEHQGTLICEARNKYGVSTQGVNVTVYCKCVFAGMFCFFVYICILYTDCPL